METEIVYLNNEHNELPIMTAYIPTEKKSDCAIVIFPGGGYCGRAQHEGAKYAEFFNEHGITAFVVDYRVEPNKFPAPLADAQRAVQTVRYYAEKYGVNKEKIAVMGSSAGGHLAAILSTYRENVQTETPEIAAIAQEDYLPNAQILCYPVIDLSDERITHAGSAERFVGEDWKERGAAFSPNKIADEKTPRAFIWHTFTDGGVNVCNSLEYVKRLREVGSNAELHVFPEGRHGKGLSLAEDKISQHVHKWTELLLAWLRYIEFI